MKILITGGEGMIGSHLTDRLITEGHEVASYDALLNFANNNKYYRKCLALRQKLFKQPAKYWADIRNINKLRTAVSDFKPDTIVHLAGLPMARVPLNHIHKTIPINMGGTLNVLKVFEESDATKIIFASSSMAYGHFVQTPQSEDFILNPINEYGACKAAGEYFTKLSKKQWVITRATAVYGFTDCANRINQVLIDAAINKTKPWTVRGETLDFTYIDDVVDGYVRCIFDPKAIGQTFNLSRGEVRSTQEFAEELKKYYPDFTYDVKEPPVDQVWRGALDITKARNILKYDPKFNIEDGIKKTLSYL